MYEWRKMSHEEREKALDSRLAKHRPWHGPPHQFHVGEIDYMFTASCFEHEPHIGRSTERLVEFENALVETIGSSCSRLFSWVVLPNHYRFLARTANCRSVLHHLRKLHGRTAFRWNGEDSKRGRQVWFGSIETITKSDRHFWATVNYIHHNPVKHGYVRKWQEWPFGSAIKYLETVGAEEAERTWMEYPVGNYGDDWDV